MRRRYDVVIIGGGIAGASLAYWLAELGMNRVALIEREDRPGVHASGRSAKVFLSMSDSPFEQAVVLQAGHFFRQPPADLSDVPFLHAAGVLLLYDEADWSRARERAEQLRNMGGTVKEVSADEAGTRMPVPCKADVAGGLWFPDEGYLDVGRLLAAYIGAAYRKGVDVFFNTSFHGLLRNGDALTGIVTGAGTCETKWVVNAAGAWAGHVGVIARATRIGFSCYRRTVISFDIPAALGGQRPEAPPKRARTFPGWARAAQAREQARNGRQTQPDWTTPMPERTALGTALPAPLPVADWPFISFESRHLYFGHEDGGLLASPMDEDLVKPGDPAPNPAVIERTRDRLQRLVPAIAPQFLRGSRAGLRTFARDRQLVLGEDPALGGFFWLAGQGGWGIESSPVIGRVAAELMVRGKSSWPDEGAIEALSPARFVRS